MLINIFAVRLFLFLFPGLREKDNHGYLFLAKARGKVRGKKYYDKGKPRAIGGRKVKGLLRKSK
jgi:hypothetical protein